MAIGDTQEPHLSLSVTTWSTLHLWFTRQAAPVGVQGETGVKSVTSFLRDPSCLISRACVSGKPRPSPSPHHMSKFQPPFPISTLSSINNQANLGGAALKFTWIFFQCIKMNGWKRKWQPTPVFSPGKSPGHRSLAGYSPWHRKELDTT